MSPMGFIKLNGSDISLSDMHIVYIFPIFFFNLIYWILDLTSKASSSQQARDQSHYLVRNNTDICFLLKSVLRS